MRRRLENLLAGVIVVGVLALCCVLAMPLIAKLLRHEVTDRYTEIAPMEERFPELAGHITATDWGVQYMVEPIPTNLEPTRTKLWGRFVIDRDLSSTIYREYEWEEAILSAAEERVFFPEWAGTQQWRFSAEFNETINESFDGNMYFDGQDTLLFYGFIDDIDEQ